MYKEHVITRAVDLVIREPGQALQQQRVIARRDNCLVRAEHLIHAKIHPHHAAASVSQLCAVRSRFFTIKPHRHVKLLDLRKRCQFRGYFLRQLIERHFRLSAGGQRERRHEERCYNSR